MAQQSSIEWTDARDLAPYNSDGSDRKRVRRVPFSGSCCAPTAVCPSLMLEGAAETGFAPCVVLMRHSMVGSRVS